MEELVLSFMAGLPESDIITCHLGKEGIRYVRKEQPDLVILDTDLPDMSGFDTLKTTNTVSSSIPIVCVTDCTDEQAVVKAMDWGASDYITIPFRKIELLAKTKSILRRQRLRSEELYSSFKFDKSMRKVFLREKTIKLTPTESMLLLHLSRNPGRVFTPDELVQLVQNRSIPHATETIRSHIHRLREKIEKDAKNPKIILTITGVGYVFAQEGIFNFN
jgi:DNA-binding response OmpR family regulator